MGTVQHYTDLGVPMKHVGSNTPMARGLAGFYKDISQCLIIAPQCPLVLESAVAQIVPRLN